MLLLFVCMWWWGGGGAYINGPYNFLNYAPGNWHQCICTDATAVPALQVHMGRQPRTTTQLHRCELLEFHH